ncbi:MAG: aspartate--tRNA ligase dps1 [Paramarteilia canceri]
MVVEDAIRIAGESCKKIRDMTDSFGQLSLTNATILSKNENIYEISELKEPVKEITIRARLTSIRQLPRVSFLILRDQNHQTMQAIVMKKSSELFKFTNKDLKSESIILLQGELVKAQTEVLSCTVKNLELLVSKIFCIGKAYEGDLLISDEMENEPDSNTNLTYVDMLHPENVEGSLAPDLFKKLNNRILDLRIPSNHSLFKTISIITNCMRSFLIENDFMEIFTPKLLGTASEGGSEFFEVKYFDKKAFLSQSPQLYKQMAICSDFNRVFTVGPVFRAENSYTHRHMTEFTGFDLEMTFKNHYHEVVRFVAKMFTNMFDHVFNKCSHHIENLEAHFGKFDPIKFDDEIRIFHYREAISLLRGEGVEIGDFEDINTTNEKLLGKIIFKKYNTHFYVIDKFPLENRAFYSMDDTDEPGSGYSNSYDFFIRGEEVLSGSQRISDAKMLLKRIEERKIDPKPLRSYINSIGLGVYPHAGVGIGLERLPLLMFGLSNIRKSSLFPRDPSRLEP